MTDNSLWRMFETTGSPYCYLLYKSVQRKTHRRPDFPPEGSLAFSGTGKQPESRF